MNSSFELGTNNHILRIASPLECIPTLSYRRKFKSQVESEELQKVGVNSIEFTSDSLKLGGQHCLENGFVSLDFSQSHANPVLV